MPYNNRYNRRIADEVDSINERYVKHIGEEYPMQGGSLDTGYDTQRVVGGARGVDEYVRNVLEGTYMVPTQAMPSSSMSGLGYSAGMRKYKGAGYSGGYRIRKDLPVEEARALARAKFEATRAMKGEQGIQRKKRTLKPETIAKRETAKALKALERRVAKEDKEERAFMNEAKRQERAMRREAREERDYQKELRRQDRAIRREEKGLAPKARKPSSWNDHVRAVAATMPKGTPLPVITQAASATYRKGLSKQTAQGIFGDLGYKRGRFMEDVSGALADLPRKSRVQSRTNLSEARDFGQMEIL